jgi:predicted ATPase with chaperone activity
MTQPAVESSGRITGGAQTLHPILPPLAPRTIEQSGLSLDMVVQLVLKALQFGGELTGSEIASRLGLGFSLIESALELLKANRHCEITGGAMIGRASYQYRITDAGRTRAALFLEHNGYVGVAPVPLEQYRRYMSAFQQAAPSGVKRQRIDEAFTHLVLSARVLDQIGPALNAGHSIFVYGPPGNGKTAISEAISRLLTGEIAIPYALEVEGNIVRFFDHASHEAISSETAPRALDTGTQRDARWVRCRRPTVVVGGELTLEALDLTHSGVAGVYRAPVQAIANGGALIIDDFGRQRSSPRDLLNRWIVPLESRVDHLTLQSGLMFELPFVALIIFATNLKPSELVDEAFLRRIRYKIFAESPTVPDFIRIFQNYCREVSVRFDRPLVERLLTDYFAPRKIELRGCQPRDLINHALSVADYQDRPRELTYELLEAACAGYFVDDTEPQAVYA